jgi:hypothetical protein
MGKMAVEDVFGNCVPHFLSSSGLCAEESSVLVHNGIELRFVLVRTEYNITCGTPCY